MQIITPVFDPDGTAFGYFERLANSIRMQEEVGENFRWTVSIQALAPNYAALIESLSRASYISIVEAPTYVKSLKEHLNLIFESVRPGPVHIMCQDDYYAQTSVIAALRLVLDSNPVAHLKPLRYTGLDQTSVLPESLEIQKVSRLDKILVDAGINRLGGLSTLAWNSEHLSVVPRVGYDLMADVEIRHVLWGATQDFWIPTIAGALIQTAWEGQAKHRLVANAHLEAKRWVSLHEASRLKALRYAALSLANSNRYLASQWVRAALYGPSGGNIAASTLR